jgi:hypothetical protein
MITEGEAEMGRIILWACSAALLLSARPAHAQTLVPPEVVRLENVQVEGEMKTVYVGNANKHYLLYCNIKAAGCITPEENKNYLLFDANTRWKMPGAKDVITLSFVQDWTVKYNSKGRYHASLRAGLDGQVQQRRKHRSRPRRKRRSR